MTLPFTSDQFFDVFRRYNESVWPAQWILFALAVVVVGVSLRGRTEHRRMIPLVMAALWLWSGIVYHFTFFRGINPAASAFAAVFVVQGFLLAWIGARRGGLRIRWRSGAEGVIGAILIGYALVGYPIVGWLVGHRFPATPTFGVPCPLAIFTFGMLVWAERPAPKVLLIIPTLWAVVGSQAALSFGVWEDLGLLVAAVAAVVSVRLVGEVPMRVRAMSDRPSPDSA